MSAYEMSSTLAGRPNRSPPGEVPLIVVFTSVLWVSAAFVGAVGLLELHLVKLTKVPLTQPTTVVMSTPMEIELAELPPPPSDADLPPESANELADSDTPTPAVVAPSPAIAFAVDTDGPAHLATMEAAGFMGKPKPVTSSAQLRKGVHRPQQLTLGQGFAADQPSPSYPREAELAGEQGQVILELIVDDQGHVATAKLLKGSQWPLLNNESLDTVLHRWRLPAGHAGVYILPITYRIPDSDGGTP